MGHRGAVNGNSTERSRLGSGESWFRMLFLAGSGGNVSVFCRNN